MRLKTAFLWLIVTGMWTDSVASDVVNGLGEWGSWKIELQEGYCELQMWHYAIKAPFYPNIMLRFRVSVRPRDGRADNWPDFQAGKLYFSIYSYLPNVPEENKLLHRIESAELDGITITRQLEAALTVNDRYYRSFFLGSSEASDLLESFSNADYPLGTVDLNLKLSNGDSVHKKVPSGIYFRTQARMLSVCMQENFSH